LTGHAFKATPFAVAQATKIGSLSGDFGTDYLRPGILATGRRHGDLRVLPSAHSCVLAPSVHTRDGHALPVAYESYDVEACQLLQHARAHCGSKAEQYHRNVGQAYDGFPATIRVHDQLPSSVVDRAAE
jgi:hypothetical protein